MAEIKEEALSRRDRKKLKKQQKQVEKTKTEEQSSIFKKMGFLVLVILGATFLWNQLQAKPETSVENEVTNSRIEGVSETDHVLGDPESQIIVTEFSDFQCPACAGYEPVLKQILGQNDNVALVYKHFPLRSIHKHAQIAAQATEAAAIQGKFREMHDKLFETQEDWSRARDPRSRFVEYAEELELDKEKFEADMNSDVTKTIVDNAYNQAISLGVNATPTIFLNGNKIDTPRSVNAFQEIINEISKDLPQTSEVTESGEISE